MVEKLNSELLYELCEDIVSSNYENAEKQALAISSFALSSKETWACFIKLTRKAIEFDTETKLNTQGRKMGKIVFSGGTVFSLDRVLEFHMPSIFYHNVAASIKKLKIMNIKMLPNAFFEGLKKNKGLDLLRVLGAKSVTNQVCAAIQKFDTLHCSYYALSQMKKCILDLKLDTLFLDIGENLLFSDVIHTEEVTSTLRNCNNFKLGYCGIVTLFPFVCLDSPKLVGNVFSHLKRIEYETQDVEFHRKRIKPENFAVFGSEMFASLTELKVEYASNCKGNAARMFNHDKAAALKGLYAGFCEQILSLPDKLAVELKANHYLTPILSRIPGQENADIFVKCLCELLHEYYLDLAFAMKRDGWKAQYSWTIKTKLTHNKSIRFAVILYQFDKQQRMAELERQEAEKNWDLPGYSSSEHEDDDEPMLVDKKADDIDLDSPGSEDNSEFDDDSDDMDFDMNGAVG